ncbi:MAG TPA: type II toxin-antitoxin system VapC family toxin [Chthonomonadaceae bacterium]|nr:type II toxin-antitoxin system VapC family toxin [Chthonomonadaceae bacterium]
MNYALDACAMIAYLRGEPGATDVAALLTDPTATCYAHTINLLEVYYDFIRQFDEPTARLALEILALDGVIERRDMNKRFTHRVGRLKARGGISLADCFCIVLAQVLSGKVVTSDHHEFDPLVPLGLCPIHFIR